MLLVQGCLLPVSEDSWPVVALTFALVGSTTFGMTMLQEIRRVSLARRWMTPAAFDRGVALVQVYPGPMMVDLGWLQKCCARRNK